MTIGLDLPDFGGIEVHVGNLRRKLSVNGHEPPLIHTVRGVGYRMSVAASAD